MMHTICPSFAQKNFIQGTVTNNHGETIKGLIDYKNWDRNPKQVSFKESLEAEIQIFSADQIREFSTNNEIYIGAIVKVDDASNSTGKLTFNSQIKYRTDTVFLLVLSRGSKTLFHYKDKIGRDHFFIEYDGLPQLLIYKRYLVNVGGSNRAAANNAYLGQLKIYLTECENLNFENDNVKYSINSLQRLFAEYFDCTSSELEFSKAREEFQSDIGVLLGGTMTKLFFESNFYPQLVNVDFPKSFNPTVGIFFDFYIPRTLRKWSINNELLYTSYKTDGRYIEQINANTSNIYEVEFAFSFIKFNTMFRYHLEASEDIKFFANMGYGAGAARNATNFQRKTSTFYGTTRISEQDAIPAIRKTELGWSFGLGLNFAKLSLQFKYEPNGGMSQVGTLGSRIRRYYLFLGYDVF